MCSLMVMPQEQQAGSGWDQRWRRAGTVGRRGPHVRPHHIRPHQLLTGPRSGRGHIPYRTADRWLCCLCLFDAAGLGTFILLIIYNSCKMWITGCPRDCWLLWLWNWPLTFSARWLWPLSCLFITKTKSNFPLLEWHPFPSLYCCHVGDASDNWVWNWNREFVSVLSAVYTSGLWMCREYRLLRC